MRFPSGGVSKAARTVPESITNQDTHPGIHPMKFGFTRPITQYGSRKMISLLNSISDLEKSQQSRDLALECYLAAIRNMAQYAVELGPETTALHRKYLEEVAEQVS